MNKDDFTGIAEWKQIQGWFDIYQTVAIQQIVKQLLPGSEFFKLGSFQGCSSFALTSAIPAYCVLYSVDRFAGSQARKKWNLASSHLLD
ncbi:MAG TPA: hypothetical protein V6D28_26200 [Leptolyngbyaceae cyanobacterium]